MAAHLDFNGGDPMRRLIFVVSLVTLLLQTSPEVQNQTIAKPTSPSTDCDPQDGAASVKLSIGVNWYSSDGKNWSMIRNGRQTREVEFKYYAKYSDAKKETKKVPLNDQYWLDVEFKAGGDLYACSLWLHQKGPNILEQPEQKDQLFVIF
jgi:hypothetical protein